ncbi:MAG: ABC transporter ATP-binding protein [Acidimicrobiia bacterium]
MNALDLVGVTKCWDELTVLDGVDLTVEPGQIVRVGGDNGAGKTTLLRIATGIVVPDAGSVTLGELRPDRDRRSYHRRLGFLAAGDRGLYARLSVRQNLEFAAGIAFLRGRRSHDAVAGAIDRFGLTPFAERRVERLSMGQRQRVRLAMTLLHTPDLVLLDEPRTSLDESGVELLANALEDVTRRGGAALWCSPTADDAVLPYDRAYELHAGKLRPW